MPAQIAIPPTIKQPVQPTTTVLQVTGVFQGARLSLLVDGQLRPDSVDAYPSHLTDTVVIPVSGPLLVAGETVLVVQQLCQHSKIGGGVPVVKGHLNVTVTPKPVIRGKTTQVVVNASDAVTGLPVPGLTVDLNGQHVGSTGTQFSYSPALGASDPAGTVEGNAAYDPAPFTIPLIDPSWTLSMQAALVVTIVHNDTSDIEIRCTNITWTVSPDYPASGYPKTIPVNSPAPPNVVTNVQLPLPTGGGGAVTVTISGTASTQGGTLNSFEFPAGPIPITPDTKTVAHNSTTETIAWLLVPSTPTDSTTGNTTLVVTPVLQGISP